MDPFLNPRTALARLSDVATQQGVPFVRRLVDGVRHAAEEIELRLLGSDFETRAQVLLDRDAGRDPFGFDAATARRAAAISAFFHRMYFRTEVYDVDRVPAGRVLLVANHSGQIPIDAAIIGCAMFFDANPPRVTRAMVEKWIATVPFVSTFFSRVGQVVGVPENARRLLEMGELVLAFPEGVRGVAKPFMRRYQLEEFGHGFMRLAMETRTPVIPVAVIGAEEQYVSLGNLKWAARALGLPVFPMIPQLLVPGGQLPLPTKYRLFFGEPMHFDGDANDDGKVSDNAFLVREAVSHLLRRGLLQRKSVFF
jgi:1-acyl-sn-glycerol-3-phosphate acyltransferase